MSQKYKAKVKRLKVQGMTLDRACELLCEREFELERLKSVNRELEKECNKHFEVRQKYAKQIGMYEADIKELKQLNTELVGALGEISESYYEACGWWCPQCGVTEATFEECCVKCGHALKDSDENEGMIKEIDELLTKARGEA